jgi:hypothetical protein
LDGIAVAGEPNRVGTAVSRLLEYGRPFQACFVIGMARHQKCEVDSELILRVLEAPLTVPLAEPECEGLGNRRHFLVELIQHVQNEVDRKGSGVDAPRVARLEFAYLRLLNGHPATPRVLHNLLKTNPEHFVGLLEVIYRSKDSDQGEGTERSEEDRARATNAYELLHSWESVPGTRPDGTIEEDALLDWVRKARSLAEEKSRLEVADSQIGNVLAHDTAASADHGWPSVPVRDVIEEIATEDLANGFEVGIYNKRGIHWRAFDAGGDQERNLAKRFRRWTETCKIEWPRTSASLARIADGYEREAARADAEAELRLT